jgi:N-acyl-D-amino-acid deacylase
MELPEAIRKLTSMPAKKIGLANRGTVAPGKAADLVMFDPENITDHATALNPFQYNAGMDMVMVNGQVVLQNNVPLQTLNGKYLSKE